MMSKFRAVLDNVVCLREFGAKALMLPIKESMMKDSVKDCMMYDVVCILY